jgi:spore coat protein U-like protein
MNWHRLLRLAVLVFALRAAAAQAVCADPGNCGCTVATTMVAFGTYDPQSNAPSDSAGTIEMSCSSSDPGQSTFSVGLSAGSSGAFAQRTLKRGVLTLAYNLYSDAGRSIIWGDDPANMIAASFPPAGGPPLLMTIYGRIPARQNAVPGAYRDVITVTVGY